MLHVKLACKNNCTRSCSIFTKYSLKFPSKLGFVRLRTEVAKTAHSLKFSFLKPINDKTDLNALLIVSIIHIYVDD